MRGPALLFYQRQRSAGGYGIRPYDFVGVGVPDDPVAAIATIQSKGHIYDFNPRIYL